MPRKSHNIHYIYKTTCNVTGRYYIGMHSTSNENDGYMGSGKLLRYSIRKYGKESHTKEILEYCDSREKLIEREIQIITTDVLNDVFCMNLKEGGDGGWKFKSEEVKIKLLNSLKMHSQKRWEDETFKNKILLFARQGTKQAHKLGKYRYDGFTGKNHTDDSKQKMKKPKNIGVSNSQYGTMWITNGVENRKIKKDSIIPEDWYKGRI